LGGEHSSKTSEEKNIQEESEASSPPNNNFEDCRVGYSGLSLSLHESPYDNIDIEYSDRVENGMRDDESSESGSFFPLKVIDLTKSQSKYIFCI